MTPEEMRAKAEALAKTDPTGAEAWMAAAEQVESIEAQFSAVRKPLQDLGAEIAKIRSRGSQKKGVR